MDPAAELLLVVMLDCSPSILVAADELFVVTVPLKLVTDAFNEPDAL
jgi:hypothetical protein